MFVSRKGWHRATIAEPDIGWTSQPFARGTVERKSGIISGMEVVAVIDHAQAQNRLTFHQIDILKRNGQSFIHPAQFRMNGSLGLWADRYLHPGAVAGRAGNAEDCEQKNQVICHTALVKDFGE